MEPKPRNIASVRIDISRLNSEVAAHAISGGLESIGKWAAKFAATLAQPETEQPDPWALELLKEAREFAERKASAGRSGMRNRWAPQENSGNLQGSREIPAHFTDITENCEIETESTDAPITNHNSVITKHNSVITNHNSVITNHNSVTDKHNTVITNHNSVMAVEIPSYKDIKTEEIKTKDKKTKEIKTKDKRPFSKENGTAAGAACQKLPTEKQKPSLTFALPVGGDLISKSFLDKILALGNFQAVRYDSKNPSITLRKVSACLRQIQNGNFLTANKWDRNWLGGRAAGLEDIPGLPGAVGTEKYSDKISEESIQHLFRVALQGLEDFRARGKAWPAGNGKIPLADFLLNDRDANACTSPMVGFAYARTCSATAGLEDKIAALPIGVQKAASAMLRWHRTEGQTPHEGKPLANFWASIARLVAWHERNAPHLQNITKNKVLPGWAEDVSTPARFIRLVGRAFQAGLVSQFPGLPFDGWLLDCPETAETDIGGGGPRWKRFVAWVEINTDATIARQATSEGVREFRESANAQVLRREGIPMDYLADFTRAFDAALEKWQTNALMCEEHPWARHRGGPPEGMEHPAHPLEISSDDVQTLATWDAMQAVRSLAGAHSV